MGRPTSTKEFKATWSILGDRGDPTDTDMDGDAPKETRFDVPVFMSLSVTCGPDPKGWNTPMKKQRHQ